MADNPKLEIFKFTLRPEQEGAPATFKDFCLNELRTKSKNVTDQEAFVSCANHVIRAFNSNMSRVDYLNKAVALKTKKSGNKLTDLKPSLKSDSFVLSGVINGGRYGRNGINATSNNEDEGSDFDENTARLIYYYIFLYLPPDSDTGLVMIHSYNREENITNAFREFIQRVFRGANYKRPLPPQNFAPAYFQEEFRKASTIKTIGYQITNLADTSTVNPISNETLHYDVNIVITPRINHQKIEQENNIQKLLRHFGLGKFDIGQNAQRLVDLNKKVTLHSNADNSDRTFEVDDLDDAFVPVIRLKERINYNPHNMRSTFEQIEQYCQLLFKNEILPEIRPDLEDVQ